MVRCNKAVFVPNRLPKTEAHVAEQCRRLSRGRGHSASARATEASASNSGNHFSSASVEPQDVMSSRKVAKPASQAESPLTASIEQSKTMRSISGDCFHRAQTDATTEVVGRACTIRDLSLGAANVGNERKPGSLSFSRNADANSSAVRLGRAHERLAVQIGLCFVDAARSKPQSRQSR